MTCKSNILTKNQKHTRQAHKTKKKKQIRKENRDMQLHPSKLDGMGSERLCP